MSGRSAVERNVELSAVGSCIASDDSLLLLLCTVRCCAGSDALLVLLAVD